MGQGVGLHAGKWGLLQPIADALKLLLKEDIIPSRVGGGGEIMLGSYKRRNWTKKEEDILRECKRRCKSPYKASMTWKQMGILLNRPQKSIRGKWRRMIEQDVEDSDEEIILLEEVFQHDLYIFYRHIFDQMCLNNKSKS